MTLIIIRSVIIYLFVVLAVRIMGKRQIGELNPHEFVITILISAVATIPLEESSIPLANSLIPILIFVSLEVLESALSLKSLKFRNATQGKPVFIIKNGVLQQQALRDLRFTMDDLIDALRQKEVFDISTVQNAVVETNGELSVQQKAQSSPATNKDLNIETQENTLPTPIIIDSKPVLEYFGKEKMQESEINLILNGLEVSAENIMLLTIDENGKTYLIRKDKSV